MTDADILVSGATGRTGGAAIDELLRRGQRIRAYVRTDDDRAGMLRQQGVDVAIGDFDQLDAIRAAMTGVRSAYFIFPIRPGILDGTARFAQAAKEAGVRAIVNMSQISAKRDAKSHAAHDHWVSERIFDWSGVPTTHIRPTLFADWLIYPHFGRQFWTNKRIEFPFAEGRHAPISTEDQGRVIAHLLANPAGHGGKIYKLHGPIEMNHHEIARAVSRTLGVEIYYSPTSIAQFKKEMEATFNFHPFLVQHLVEVARDYRDGVFAGTNDTVEQITGTPPLSVASFVRRHRGFFT